MGDSCTVVTEAYSSGRVCGDWFVQSHGVCKHPGSRIFGLLPHISGTHLGSIKSKFRENRNQIIELLKTIKSQSSQLHGFPIGRDRGLGG